MTKLTNIPYSGVQVLCEELNTLGYRPENTTIKVNNIIEELLSLQDRSPQAIFSDSLHQLSKIQRFSGSNITLYRDDVGVHQNRVENMGSFSINILKGWNNSHKRGTFENRAQYDQNQDFSYVGKSLHIPYFLLFLRYHDIPEGIFKVIGDIPTHIKKLLSPAASETLSEIEIAGLDSIGSQGFDTTPEMYTKIRSDTKQKKSINAYIGSYYDKLDALCSCMLEVIQGNKERIVPLIRYIRIFQQMSSTPLGYVIRDISKYAEKQEIKGQGCVSDLFNIDEIISLDQGFDVHQNEVLEKELWEKCGYMRENDLFSHTLKNAFDIGEGGKLPGFFKAWLQAQKQGDIKQPAKYLGQQIAA